PIVKANGSNFGEPLLAEGIQRHRHRIASYSYEDRITRLRLRPDRADVIIPAADIFLRVMDLAGVEEVYVPKVGLADGIVYDLYMRQFGDQRYVRERDPLLA